MIYALVFYSFLGRIAVLRNVDAAYCYQCSVICPSVCLSVTIVSPATTADPIEMSFGSWTRVGPRNHMGVQVPTGRGTVEGGKGGPL